MREPWEPSPCRVGLDKLLEAYPMFDLVRAWIPGREEEAAAFLLRAAGESVEPMPSPWLCVELGQAGGRAFAIWQFAIFRRTGAVHTMREGAVSDDPIFEA